MNPRDVSMEQVALQWLKVGVTNAISREFAESVSIETMHEAVFGQMLVALKAKVLADQLPPEYEYDRRTFRFYVPASPWQQFKASHADSWWLRWLVARRPVRQVEHKHTGELRVDLRRYHTFPQARITAPEFGAPVRVVLLDREVRWLE